MAALVEACKNPDFGAHVCCVISDVAQAPGVIYAKDAGIPTAVVALEEFESRESWDHALAATLRTFDPDLVMCAGFMRILGSPVLDAFPDQVVNTHPALLPQFPGAHAVRDALAAGVTQTGCTVMIVDEGIDTGPVVAQEVVEVRENDTEETLRARIQQVEKPLVVATLGRMIREGWTVDGRAVHIGTGGSL